MKKRIMALVLCAVMVLTLPATGTLAADLPEDSETSWQTSKSKTATQLNADFESRVTLSLPSAEEQLVSDIVFVLDKSTSAEVEDEALTMLSELKAQVSKTKAKVKVGVVIFNKEAHVTKFKDLETEYDSIEEAIRQEISSGTNTHAGLLAGKAMLDNDTAVEASRKYLIFVSDGITYMYNEEPTAVAWSFNNPNSKDDWHGSGSWSCWAGPDNWYSKYHTNDAPEEGWSVWLETIGKLITEQGTEYEYPYGETATKATSEDIKNWDKNYAMSIDKALYLTWKTYTECVEAGYSCYSMTAQSSGSVGNLWGPSFMNFLAGNKEVSFDTIQNDILYLLDAGSKVVDFMGNDTDDHGNTYDFKFVPEAAKLTLTVGGQTYTTVEAEPMSGETARFQFTFDGVTAANQAEAPFVLHYYENGTEQNPGEHFVWDINVPVSNFAPVQLTYSVVLTDPQTAAGTYGEYDGNGSRGLGALYTNVEAVLYPVDSNGNEGSSEAFPKPTVSYTVESSSHTMENPSYRDTETIIIGGGEKEEKNPETGAPVFTLPGAVVAARAFL